MTRTGVDGLGTETLADGFEGVVLHPHTPGYDEARTVFNAMIDRRPAVIAQCRTVRDVSEAVRFGRERGLQIAVRGGGHSVAGNGLSDGGLVVDLRRMCAVEVDHQARTARVEGGATWGHLDRACQPHGLATTGGRVSTTGVGGLTLGGGSGWLERGFGLACDNLLSVDLVTADGRTLTASEDQNPDLFWALHGGGGNFGVATALTFRLHPLPRCTLGLLLWPAEAGPDVVRRYRDLVAGGASEALGGAMLYLTGPPEEFVPPHLQGRLAVACAAVFAGGEGAAREAIRPMLDLQPDAEMVAEMPYADIQCALDDPPGYRNYWSAEHLRELPDAAVDAFCARARDMIVPSPSQDVLVPWGGAVARDADSWPLPHRRAPWVVHPFGLWEEPADDQRGRSWARAVCADMAPYATGQVYLNFIGDEGVSRVVAGYGAENYERLATVKAQYDPHNVFRLNHNIRPAGAEPGPPSAARSAAATG
ncbi:MAG: FAD-binding oxidoreductase [Actinomycetota bacterium]|nr:FAD-binding oxidoreductase [Actinomycetota bacterium]